MKKVILIFLTFFLLVFISIIIYWNLPFKITRKSDIIFGNKLIENIESYKAQYNELPHSNDLKVLEKLGFKMEFLGTKPTYIRNYDEYELIYLEGFDGPYLMWNSNEKKWKIDFPTNYTDNQKKYDRINVIYEKEGEKLIYIVNKTGIDNYKIEFYLINQKDSTKIFDDNVNDAVFTSNTYKIEQTEKNIIIKTPFPIEKKSVITESQIEIILTN